MSSMSNYLCCFPWWRLKKRPSRNHVDTFNTTVVLEPPSDILKEPIALSPFDAVMPSIYMLYLYIYRNPNPTAEFMPTDKLVASLRKTLDAFPVLYGELQDLDDGRVQVIAPPTTNGNGIRRGVPVTVKQSDLDLDTLEPLWRLDAIPSELIAADSLPPTRQSPLFVARITRFAPMHHTITDGYGLVLFLKTWAANMRDDPTSPPPVAYYDPTLLVPNGPPTYDHPEYHWMKPEYREQYNDPTYFDAPPASTRTGMFRISKERLITLKREAMESLDSIDTEQEETTPEDTSGKPIKSNTPWVSTSDALAALIWRAGIRANGHAPEKPSHIHLSLNGRSRWEPPLADGLFGNGTFRLGPRLSTADLLTKPIGHVAYQIRKESEKMTGAYLQSTINLKATLVGQRNKVKHALPINIGIDFSITNVVALNVYELDFGYGNPVCFRLPVGLREDRASVIPAPKSFEGVEVIITLTSDAFSRLLMDTEFTHYAQFTG
ncbi:transferase [Syncephalis plumigaleata]|nr:transferase [Syncephalis plumigaleata]